MMNLRVIMLCVNNCLVKFGAKIVKMYVLNFETQERYLGWQVDEETDELSVIIEDVYGFRWNSLLDLETADYRFEDFEEFAEDYVDTSDLLKQFGK